MSGDNEETQTSEETSVDEKVTVRRIGVLSETLAPLTSAKLTLLALLPHPALVIVDISTKASYKALVTVVKIIYRAL